MAHFVNLLKQFRADERGVFGMIFAIIAVVLIALGGAVVDFVHVQQVRNQTQVALDAAALGLQQEIFVKPLNLPAIQTSAQLLVDQQIGDSTVRAMMNTPVVDIPNGSLTLSARVVVPTFFVTLVGVDTLEANLVSQATRKMLDLEVAMVLDNSGSMAQSKRMTYLKDAARCATNILFYTNVNANCDAVSTVDPAKNVKIGIVPFTHMVNVGTQFKSATWLDWMGESMIGKLNFDSDDNSGNKYSGSVDRKALFTQTGTQWRGCVEARLSPYDTNDTAPTTPNTKFVPMFAPDPAFNMAGYNYWSYSFDRNASNSSTAYNYGYNFNNYLSDVGGTCSANYCTRTVTQKNCATNWSGDMVCTGTPTYSYVTTKNGVAGKASSTSCISNGMNIGDEARSKSGTTVTTVTRFASLTEQALQERLCKYNGQKITESANYGPNANCPNVAILPLTATATDVLNRIKDMRADGGTNIQQGAVWGLHALTPGEPLIEALPTGTSTVSKVMIIMTDGFNEPDFRAYDQTFNGTAIYGSWGFRKDGRLPDTDGILNNENEYSAHNSKADMTAAIDAKTLATCASAKAPGTNIIVYTIGLSPPSAETRKMLEDCSSGTGYSFFPSDPSELVGVFKTIAGQLAQLRIAQ